MTDTAPSAPSLSSAARGLTYDVVVVGGGAAGLSTAASILKRRGGITVAIIEPSASHFYQPGWTLVGGGVFKQSQTRRSEKRLIPAGADWVQAAATGFEPESNLVHLSSGSSIRYSVLVVATGLTLNWDGIEGLGETLGRNGVTSNYRYDLAPYTWQLVQTLGRGNAVFTQPPMPIKCAGAPQKAMYLACDAWRRRGLADNINVSFHTATPGLFGVKEFVPPLMEYIHRYHIDLCLKSNLKKVDGKNRIATFENVAEDGSKTTTETEFDMLHVVPPQCAPEVIRNSPLAGEGGWVSVDPATLRHTRFENVFALGDVAGTSNAKTAAAVRVQAPVVAVNVLAALDHKPMAADYDGYGACPLTVERGRIVLAEFGYGGKLEPTLPTWLLDGRKPTHLAWFLKEWVMPVLYWDGMLKGRELMVAPHRIGTPR
ncbi:Sulfide:quinone oxidoreductase [Gluconacetobacter sp. SXCC-1]|uniref:NAD(P)/FAD-dependent oxidoreductase n=1 Tax=Komagataeibacter rhaeticus TaxID=215221 RepID=A0A181CDH6_9PROT|nr:FAD/NAD(P)-binding oxidoreductase [Komagataeibacter rhaeticus]ATU71708.1 NAD(P)/FAD-dependent oxidoreductase [Komagataeibacter xylinus]EGG77415.1 Sulfide:quinone oxidoreductase [Gluconacetobacter sp. SXCC-1]QIP36213.1 NAD(P)/FAD-dependent oxidoreductase [Komagataeibacter rhaeticus]QOC45974.1 NAD(P)/FAD-dependent oxidoreductase [Komagataeibacter rhaeticus]WPP21417.1 FAD/NAD(P)-binding oxidoreductase [Komagataeibacter rhaeticus]